ncbi:Lrp/AsnC family transcriptional regulator [Heyndrickxia sporothermodurans]|uniref:Lrp/AsnC family transcriptional regulator n=1 Tax=Heyndrickxia sporothermodurans TaxID=46224 RepID=A0AB37HFY0_9BACI|nr:Lrp/AsnC family transcriptional regulator [Heyndrickxia sporothermodurans]MBL5768500.1 Lrp/AsnC family transcriptional regulator [Heyndrickxia sporothermodurans]MBL5772205.1 Lrp/AsnC family transcriptional regulator [Heyndrickxia sporothermodurans]MBL5775759.1 Lrp/AsnC family transcriptional regulator [Heyndrickxia sporothermodurans]MBL5782887.1 Lrp/AsnC family transcriptional regulator [Heyndrickxia sporothermodurans]MBL5786390.1 Lrp/AsnC family transcriptional regulator [Heyndrickxia spor
MNLDEKVIRVLEIIENNARIPLSTLAKMVNLSEADVTEIIKDLEKRNIIASYVSVINWSKLTEQEMVTALIDVKVTPKRGVGFDDVAERIYRFPQVKSVYLMSGAFDLSVEVEGKTMLEVASFVSDKLATIDSVISTSTHFILKKFKHDGVILGENEKDRRMIIQP